MTPPPQNQCLKQAGHQPQSAIPISRKRNNHVTKGKYCKTLSLWNPAVFVFKAVWATKLYAFKKKKKGDESSWKCFREQRLFIQYLTTLWFHKTGHSPALCGGLIPVRLWLWLTEIKAEELCSITISLEQSNTYSHSRSPVLIFTAGHVTWRCITTVVDASRRSAVKDGAAGDWSPTSLNITFIL